MQYPTTTPNTPSPASRFEMPAIGAGLLVAVALALLVLSRVGLLPMRGTEAALDGVALTIENMAFGRNTLHARAGEPLTLALTNRDGYGHSFDIDELDVHIPLPAARSAAVTFTPTTPGSYTIYCAVPGHAAAGMTGTLVVEP